MENSVTIRPVDSKEIITAVIAPGPARSGNARGTIPVSSLMPLPTKRHPPPVNSSIATMNSNTPPATMKLEKVIPKTVKIRLPAMANAKSKAVDVIMTVFESCILLVLSIFCVSAIYIGTIPTGFKTTSNAMVDLSMCRKKSSGRMKGKSIIFNASHTCRRILFY